MADQGRAATEFLIDLLDRTQQAEKVVKRLARDSAVAKSTYAYTEANRLQGKAEGLRIAIAYIREALKDAEEQEEATDV